MKEIKVLGMGCPKCKATFQRVQDIAARHGYDGNISKEEDIAAIVSYGVTKTPAVTIDGKIVFSGGVPSSETIEEWFSNPSTR